MKEVLVSNKIMNVSRKERIPIDQIKQTATYLEDFYNAVLRKKCKDISLGIAFGWCYQLEEYGLYKGDLNKAQALITNCRKSGLLPLEIVAEDSACDYECLETLNSDPEDEAGA
jgi:hypothetical protein